METPLKNASRIDRIGLLKPRVKEDKQEKVRIIGTFDDRARDVKNILKKYWGILKMDKDIGSYVSDRQSITYRKG